MLGHRIQDVHGAPAHQPEVADVRGDIDFGQPPQQPIEQGGGGCLERGFPGAGAALAVDHVMARVHQGHHVAEQRRRILQVRIDRQHAIAAAEGQAGGQGLLVAKISRQVDRDHMRVPRSELLDQRERVVLRSIVDEHDLVVVTDAATGGFGGLAMELEDAVLFVVAGRNDGEPWGHHDGQCGLFGRGPRPLWANRPGTNRPGTNRLGTDPRRWIPADWLTQLGFRGCSHASAPPSGRRSNHVGGLVGKPSPHVQAILGLAW